jgi:hypothetical protein
MFDDHHKPCGLTGLPSWSFHRCISSSTTILKSTVRNTVDYSGQEKLFGKSPKRGPSGPLRRTVRDTRVSLGQNQCKNTSLHRSPPRTSQRSSPRPRRPPTHPSPRARSARWLGCMSTPRRWSLGIVWVIGRCRGRGVDRRPLGLGGKLLLRVLGIAEVLRGRARLVLPLVAGVVRRTSAFLALAHVWVEKKRKEKNKKQTSERCVKTLVKQALYLYRKKATAHLLPRSPNSRKYSRSHSNRLETSQTADVVSRNTTPIGTEVNCLMIWLHPTVTSNYYSGAVC